MDALNALRAFAALAVVLGIILGLAWALRRFGGRITSVGERLQDLQVVHWKTLDMRRKLAVIRWGEEEHLVCLAPSGDTLIASRAAPASFKPIAPDAPDADEGAS